MESLAEVLQSLNAASSSPSSDTFSAAGMALVKAKNQIREEMQALTVSTMKPIIKKLQKNQPLSGEEKDLIRLWIVGEAAAFTQKDNDFREWLEEFKKLGQTISDISAIPGSLPEMLDLYGILEEAVRLAGDLQFFLDEKERVGRFEQSIQNLSASDAELLANILQEKLTSPEM